MSRPSRLRRWRILKWGGLLLSCSMLVVGVVSMFAEIGFTGGVLGMSTAGHRTPGISVGAGSLDITMVSDRNPKWYFRAAFHPPRYDPYGPYIFIERPHIASPTEIMTPLWIPLVIVGLPTAYLFWRDRRRILPGQCLNCGYNLTGNTSGICPECGEKV